MSRIPQSRTPSKPAATSSRLTATPSKGKSSGLAPPTPRARTTSTPRAPTPSKPRQAEEAPALPSAPTLSIKEAIALKRAEAKKAQSKAGGRGSSGLDSPEPLEDAIPDAPQPEEEDLLGRLPIRDTIERARSTGSLNLAGRSLLCLPSALYEIHLNITPDKLKSVPDEQVLPPSEPTAARRGRGAEKTTWFEAQDLTILKAWNNEIEEIQHEISLFGSLKTVDLHKNKITSLPKSFADLTSLTILDLSHNGLVEIPENLFALPELVTLNLSHNRLTSLPFNAPFKDAGRSRGNHQVSGGFFTSTVTRSTTPLPRLYHLDASHNSISADSIHTNLPVSLLKVDLSHNPLGQSQALLRSMASLKRLKEIKMEHAQIGDDSFPSTLLESTSFPCLKLLDVSETQVLLDSVQAALTVIKQELDFNFTTGDPPEGFTRVLVGKRVLKEAWEIEMEKRAGERVHTTVEFTDDWTDTLPPKRNAGREDTISPTPAEQPPLPKPDQKKVVPAKPKEVVKEAWEIELEQGLATAGGRRRARAAAAAAEVNTIEGGSRDAKESVPQPVSPSTSISLGLGSPQYYNSSTQTLTLPASAPPPKAGHGRAFSMAGPISRTSSRNEDLSVPAPSLPLSIILTQPFADTLKVLNLGNRRMDRSFALPSMPMEAVGFLPCLEELDLEGCNLGDLVSISISSGVDSGTATPPRSNEPLLPMIAKCFPSLRTLNLSYNALSNASLTSTALSHLILASPHRKGLRHLRLRGNRLSELDGFQILAESFKGNRENPYWKVEELDVRDNELGKIPPELGLLPLDVFLVDGNTFRVPQRRVWEREGTKGLLSWLRGRIE
ncbi:hypothetical protein CPB83DRAFT_787495 [Crepidotus variabilis]|uniref:Leucine-rich repeat-containing protein 40 n=1 Tax=Crepidotus variabilis TaxID=179855 RepID=A0A9P6EL90_9AGAR|nr:hypothetical protein CPB83DRAFT_787495 [Crepidotus variabilis]